MHAFLVLEQLLNGFQFGMTLFLMVAGLTLIFGIMNLINLAHGLLYMIGAYIAAWSFSAWHSVLAALASDQGQVLFEGHDITAEPPYRRAARGLIRSFQVTSVFPEFSVLDNVALAVQAHASSFRFWRPARRDPALRDPARASPVSGWVWCRRVGRSFPT